MMSFIQAHCERLAQALDRIHARSPSGLATSRKPTQTAGSEWQHVVAELSEPARENKLDLVREQHDELTAAIQEVTQRIRYRARLTGLNYVLVSGRDAEPVAKVLLTTTQMRT